MDKNYAISQQNPHNHVVIVIIDILSLCTFDENIFETNIEINASCFNT